MINRKCENWEELQELSAQWEDVRMLTDMALVASYDRVSATSRQEIIITKTLRKCRLCWRNFPH